MLKSIVSAIGAVVLLTSTALAQEKPADPAAVQKVIADMFKGASPEWKKRIEQDETQKLCSQYRNQPPAAVAEAIMKREAATVVYPSDGSVLGNWKAGEALAQRGTGGQFTDNDKTPIGGNCYACHQLDKKELSFGTLAPSLTEYGKIRKFKPDEAKAAYAKIYNAQAMQACSNMPRFGHNKFLSEQNIKDLTAYLFDPESPVNN